MRLCLACFRAAHPKTELLALDDDDDDAYRAKGTLSANNNNNKRHHLLCDVRARVRTRIETELRRQYALSNATVVDSMTVGYMQLLTTTSASASATSIADYVNSMTVWYTLP